VVSHDARKLLVYRLLLIGVRSYAPKGLVCNKKDSVNDAKKKDSGGKEFSSGDFGLEGQRPITAGAKVRIANNF
jgi:hypothetical protein